MERKRVLQIQKDLNEIKNNILQTCDSNNDLFIEDQLKNYFNKNLTLVEKKQLLTFLNHNYYDETSEPKIDFDDTYYDILQKLYQQQTNILVDHTTVTITNKRKKMLSSQSQSVEVGPNAKKMKSDQVDTKLPIWLGSMDKIQLPTDSEKKCERKLLQIFGLQKDQIITNIEPIEISKNSFLLTNENTIIFEDKLDGLSCLLEYTKQQQEKEDKSSIYFLTNMFSRGNGEIGQNLTTKASFLKSTIQTQIEIDVDCIKSNRFFIRGELIISKENFDLYNNDFFIDSRRAVNSFVINKKSSFQDNPLFHYIEFVAYEFILDQPSEENKQQQPQPQQQFAVLKQLQLLKKFQFQVVNHFIFVMNETQTNKKISWNENCFCLSVQIGNIQKDQKEDYLLTKYFQNFLIDWKTKSKYKIDGLIVQNLNKNYIRNTIGNPKYAFAFKCNHYTTTTTTYNNNTIATAEIFKVEWNVSRHGKSIPRICLCELGTNGKSPVILQDTEISFVSAKNAKYVIQNNINQGTILEIAYSGDVIPNIVRIIKSSKYPSLPYEKELNITENNWQDIIESNTFFKWDDNKVQFIDLIELSKTEIKKIVHFFDQINCKSFGKETINRIYESGFQSIQSILKMQIKDFLKVPRIKSTLANKLYENMHQAMNRILENPKNHIQLFNACSLFEGISIKKLELIEEHFPNFLYDKQIQKQITQESLKNIDSFSDITAKKVMSSLQNAISWYYSEIVSCFSYFHYNNDQFLLKSTTTITTSSTSPSSATLSDSSIAVVDLTKTQKQKTFTFTDFRDDLLKRDIENLFGYKFSETMSKRDTAFLIVHFTHCPNEFKLKENEILEDKNISEHVTGMAGNSVTSKMKKASQMKIPVYNSVTMRCWIDRNKT